MKNLLNKIKTKINLSPEAEEYIFSIAKEKTIHKGDILIRQGQTVKKVYYVKSGCLRSYCIDKNGKEHTLLFSIKDWWMSDYIAIYSDEISTLSVECLVDSKVIAFSQKALEKSLELFPEFEVYQRKNLEQHLVSLHKRILNQLQLSASERYDLFLEQYPDIEQHTRNYHIASYLGVTQESLSRIRIKKSKK